MDVNSAYIVIVGATIGEVVGEKSSTNTVFSVCIDDLIVDSQTLEDHGGV